MARRVFFSFHYERDVWRAGQVRNSWVTKPDREEAGYIDAVSWQAVKEKGDDAIKKWIEDQLDGTTVTIVLIGAETSEREWVKHEILSSEIRGNGLLGIYINNLKDQNRETDVKGTDPFEKMGYSGIKTYDWVSDGGYDNLGDWVEQAYDDAQRTVFDLQIPLKGWEQKFVQFSAHTGDRIKGFVKEMNNNWLKVYLLDQENYEQRGSLFGTSYIYKCVEEKYHEIDFTVTKSGTFYLIVGHNDWHGRPETAHIKLEKNPL
jgi:hypothetical protein